jgi:RimJ/RimL family protein N-acetyltransferase
MSTLPFPKLYPSAKLHYERLSLNNFKHLYKLFKDDKSPYVLEDFKNRQDTKDYVKERLEVTQSVNRSGCDWFIKTQNQTYTGILHLYELNRNKKSDSCCIGISITKRFRCQGIASEAIQHLLNSIFAHFEHIKTVTAYTKPDNVNMINLLKKLNFSTPYDEFIDSEIYSFFRCRRDAMLRVYDALEMP